MGRRERRWSHAAGAGGPGGDVPVLDYEAELAAIIDAVDSARRGQGAYVQVLNWGHLAVIREALLAGGRCGAGGPGGRGAFRG